MRALYLLAALALASACAAPHAVKVRCDRHLVPINPPVQTVAGASSGAAQTRPRSAAP